MQYMVECYPTIKDQILLFLEKGMELMDIHFTKWSRLDTERKTCFFSTAESTISHPESVDVSREENYGGHEDGRRMNR